MKSSRARDWPKASLEELLIFGRHNELAETHLSDSWIWRGHASYVWRYGQERRLQAIQRHVMLDRRRILDVGCGIGTYVERLSQLSSQVHGIDVDRQRIRAGRERGLSLLAGTAEELPFDDDSIDVVLLNEVIEHVRDDRQALKDAFRVLRPGGDLVIFAPNRLYPFETHGAYFGERFVFGLIPLVNYLPDRIRNRFCPHVRAYLKRDIRRLFVGLPAEIQVHSFVYPGFDNIFHRSALLGTALRTVCYRLESTPLRVFGLSHFVIARKVAASESHPARSPVHHPARAAHGE